MEKTIVIDGKPIRFAATGALMLRYKQQFGREYLADAIRLEEFSKTKAVAEDGKIQFDYTKLDLELMYNILWTMAKTADPSVPDPITWLDGFDTFPVFQVYNQLKDIMQGNMRVDRKNAAETV